jgi:hypothetical protein
MWVLILLVVEVSRFSLEPPRQVWGPFTTQAACVRALEGGLDQFGNYVPGLLDLAALDRDLARRGEVNLSDWRAVAGVCAPAGFPPPPLRVEKPDDFGADQ